jgi:hypothetical protein
MGAESGVAPLNGRFAGREAFVRLLGAAFERAAREGWSELMISDASFEDWPLRDAATVQSLQAWARPGRRLVMLAGRFDRVLRDHPRFVTWRKTHSHLIDCRVSPAHTPGGPPSAFWSPHWFLHRTDLEACSGEYGVDRPRWMALRESVASVLRGSRPGFPATTLGL